MSKKYVHQIATMTGLSSIVKGPWDGPAAVGAMDGFPVAVGLQRNERQASVVFLVRFSRGSWTGGLDGLKSFAESSGALREAIGGKGWRRTVGGKPLPKTFLILMQTHYLTGVSS